MTKSLLSLLVVGLLSCTTAQNSPTNFEEADPHSFSNPSEVTMTHLNAELGVDFDRKVISGTAILTLRHNKPSQTLVLDSNNLKIRSVVLDDGKPTKFEIGEGTKGLGQPLRIAITEDTKTVKIVYETSPEAEALQWLTREQTANRQHPFLYSQSQPVFARTWIPCQDSPGIRFTYEAKVTVPLQLLAVMSAENPKMRNRTGVYEFKMPQPIPAYLLALAVGDLEYRPFDRRTGVYTESSLMARAHAEFQQLPKMMAAAENLFGPYQWGQYDILVLPPSFPFGGMENPRLSFLTPSLLAGDRSLVSVVAHELAHSWTGNLVTNANLNHFWLNEGFTTFAERRIVEALYGVDARELQAKNGESEALETIEGFNKDNTPEYSKLRMKLSSDVNPDDAFSSVPYEKGYLFLRSIEAQVGREAFDGFLRQYIETFKWRAINTEQFLEFLEKNLVKGDAQLRSRLNIQAWVYEPGMPAARPVIESKALQAADSLASGFMSDGTVDMSALATFSVFQKLRFISMIPRDVDHKRLDRLDATARLSQSRNAEIMFAWLKLGLEANYPVALRHVEGFLESIGRGKFVNPLFKLLIERAETRAMAEAMYRRLKPGYHSIVQNRIEKLLKEKPAN